MSLWTAVVAKAPVALIIGRVSAYVDESLRLEGAGLYVLAAVVVPDERAAAVRAALRSGLRRGQRRFHWHEESAASRAALATRVRNLGLGALAVVTRPVDARRPERARRHCLLRLLWELDQRGVVDLVIESRRHADTRDRQAIEHARRGGWSRETRYRFAQPDEECLLWLPDVVAGAVAGALGDGVPEHLALLGDAVVLVDAA